MHLFEHLAGDPSKTTHSVFKVDTLQEAVETVDETWKMRGVGVLQSNGNRIFNISMGHIVDTAGETSLRIVVRDGTSKTITAFPIHSVSSGLTTLLANTYDGAGVREIKTTAADGTVYFLLDASGAPVVEETYTISPTPTTTLSTISAFGPDGLRERYTVPTGSETAFFYDPQGTLVNRIASVDSGVAVNGEPMTDVSVWDGYGQQRSDQWTNRTVDSQYTPSDPVGFEGQAGYYADWELAQTSNPAPYVYLRSTPSLLTHRYYDPSTGRFVNRDPIGYQGGANLYGYCGGNPVNESDPKGTAT